MESSYKKLKNLKDETIFQIKTALKSKRLHWNMWAQKRAEGKNEEECNNALNLENALTLDYLLDELCKLYEIE